MKPIAACSLLALSLCIATPSLASPDQRRAGDWLIRGGAAQIWPKGSNHDLIDVEEDLGIGFSVTRMVTDTFGVELLAALPFSHDIRLRSTARTIGSTNQLPPTLSFQYHFPVSGPIKPYVGAGLNVTVFFDEELDASAGLGERLDLDTSFGLALQAGADFYVSDRTFVNLKVRWIDIDTDATVRGSGGTVDVGTIEVDPLVVGLHVGWEF